MYGDSSLDWVVLLSNNVHNVYEEWPKTQYAFDKHLIEKYGDYDTLYNGVHHYETIESKSRNGFVIVEGGVEVNEGFFNAPEYEIELDPNVILPSEVPGIFAEATGTYDPVTGTVKTLTITNPGTGYTDIGEVSFADPPNPRLATLDVALNVPPDEREVGSITIIDAGTGYTYQPLLEFSDPPPTVTAVLEATIGAGGTI